MSPRFPRLSLALPLLLAASPALARTGTAALYPEAERSALEWDPKSCLTEMQYLAPPPVKDERSRQPASVKFRFISLRNPRWNMEQEFALPADPREQPAGLPQRESGHRPYTACVPEPGLLLDHFEALERASKRGFRPAKRLQMKLLVVDEQLTMFSAALFRNIDGAPVWMLEGADGWWAMDASDGKLYLRVPMENPEATAKLPDYPEQKLEPRAAAEPEPKPGLKWVSGEAAPVPCRVAPKSADRLKGNAGCWIWVKDKVLVVERRVRDSDGALRTVIDLPGGFAAAGERAQCAAHRRTAEDLGLDAEVGRLIRVFNGEYHLYECRLDPADAGAKAFKVPKNRAGDILRITVKEPAAIQAGEIWSAR